MIMNLYVGIIGRKGISDPDEIISFEVLAKTKKEAKIKIIKKMKSKGIGKHNNIKEIILY